MKSKIVYLPIETNHLIRQEAIDHHCNKMNGKYSKRRNGHSGKAQIKTQHYYYLLYPCIIVARS